MLVFQHFFILGPPQNVTLTNHVNFRLLSVCTTYWLQCRLALSYAYTHTHTKRKCSFRPYFTSETLCLIHWFSWLITTSLHSPEIGCPGICSSNTFVFAFRHVKTATRHSLNPIQTLTHLATINMESHLECNCLKFYLWSQLATLTWHSWLMHTITQYYHTIKNFWKGLYICTDSYRIDAYYHVRLPLLPDKMQQLNVISILEVV